MLIVADSSPITQQYRPYAEPAIEHVSEITSFHKMTMGNNEFMVVMNPHLFKSNL